MLAVLLLLAVLAAHALERQPELLAARPARQALLVPHPLPVGCSGRVEAAAVQTQVVQVEQAVLVVAALVVAAVVQHAVHTPLARAA